MSNHILSYPIISYLSIYLSECLSVCLYERQYDVSQSIYLFQSFHIYLSIYLYVYLSVSMYVLCMYYVY